MPETNTPERLTPRATSKSEWWARSSRNPGRDQIGTPGRDHRNQHLKFMLLLGRLDPAKFPLLHQARYRPGRIVVSYPASTHWITMSWEDGKAHEHLTVQFVRPVPQTPA